MNNFGKNRGKYEGGGDNHNDETKTPEVDSTENEINKVEGGLKTPDEICKNIKLLFNEGAANFEEMERKLLDKLHELTKEVGPINLGGVGDSVIIREDDRYTVNGISCGRRSIPTSTRKIIETALSAVLRGEYIPTPVAIHRDKL